MLYEIIFMEELNMKKKIIGISIAALFFLGGCSAASTKTKDTSDSKSYGTVVVDTIQFKVKPLNKVNVIKDDGKTTQILYGFEIKGENLSYMESPGFGASDFVLTTEDGKEHKIDDSIAYFGSEIAPNKSYTGKVYFSLDKKQKTKQLQYKVGDKVIYSWDV